MNYDKINCENSKDNLYLWINRLNCCLSQHYNKMIRYDYGYVDVLSFILLIISSLYILFSYAGTHRAARLFLKLTIMFGVNSSYQVQSNTT